MLRWYPKEWVFSFVATFSMRKSAAIFRRISSRGASFPVSFLTTHSTDKHQLESPDSLSLASLSKLLTYARAFC
eukprot:4328817-Pleurochrysis_carterae.AAC.1